MLDDLLAACYAYLVLVDPGRSPSHRLARCPHERLALSRASSPTAAAARSPPRTRWPPSALGPVARIPRGGVRREALARRRGLPAARRDARPDDLRAGTARRSAPGRNSRRSTRAAGSPTAFRGEPIAALRRRGARAARAGDDRQRRDQAHAGHRPGDGPRAWRSVAAALWEGAAVVPLAFVLLVRGAGGGRGMRCRRCRAATSSGRPWDADFARLEELEAVSLHCARQHATPELVARVHSAGLPRPRLDGERPARGRAPARDGGRRASSPTTCASSPPVFRSCSSRPPVSSVPCAPFFRRRRRIYCQAPDFRA